MHVVVIGGGVVGVTTAWELCRRGHQVTVLERHSLAGNETSKANAAQRSYGVVYPWADPAMVLKALPWLIKQDGPLKMGLPPSLATIRFLFATLRYAWSPGLYGFNKRAMLRLAMHSRERFLALESELALQFDGAHNGLLHLASTPEALNGYRDIQRFLSSMDVPARILNSAEVQQQEPGMHTGGPLYGALSYDTDGTGDCHLFSRELARACEEKGVVFRYQVEVEQLLADDQRVNSVILRNHQGQRENLEADAVVVSAGCWSDSLTRPLGQPLPIYPVKGYSLTATITDAAKAPVSTVHDDQYKVVMTRLGDRLRATAFVELNDFDRGVPEARLETIKKSVLSRFPGCTDIDSAESWTGFRPMTPDGPAIIGRGSRDNLYLNTGHGVFGWTLAPGSADVIASLIDGQPPAVCLDAFRPERFSE